MTKETFFFSTKTITRLLVCLETDCVWNQNSTLTVALQILTASEGLYYLLMLVTIRTFYSSDRYQLYFFVICCVALYIKTLMYTVTYYHFSKQELYSLLVEDEGKDGEDTVALKEIESEMIDT